MDQSVAWVEIHTAEGVGGMFKLLHQGTLSRLAHRLNQRYVFSM